MSLPKRLLDSVNIWKHNCRPIKATDDYSTTSCGLTLKQECEMGQWCCGGDRPKVETRVFMPQGMNPVWQAGSKIHSTLPLTNHHQHGSNQLWVKRCWWKKNTGSHLNHPPPHIRRPDVLIYTSSWVRKDWETSKLTWLFWAKGQKQTCQWLRQLARHKTPQLPSVSPPVPKTEIWTFPSATTAHINIIILCAD